MVRRIQTCNVCGRRFTCCIKKSADKTCEKCSNNHDAKENHRNEAVSALKVAPAVLQSTAPTHSDVDYENFPTTPRVQLEFQSCSVDRVVNDIIPSHEMGSMELKSDKQQMFSIDNGSSSEENDRDKTAAGSLLQKDEACVEEEEEEMVDTVKEEAELNAQNTSSNNDKQRRQEHVVFSIDDDDDEEYAACLLQDGKDCCEQVVNISNVKSNESKPQTASIDHNTATVTRKTNASDSTTTDCCAICGSSLQHLKDLKARVNHMKRCAKKHGVRARMLKADLDSQDFITHNENVPTYMDTKTTTTQTNNNTINKNPYQPHTSWHKDSTTTTTLQRQQQTTLQTFFTKKPRTIDQVLMGGAKIAAKAASLLRKQATSNTNNASSINNNKKRKRGGGWGRGPYERSTCPSYKQISGTNFVVDGFMYAKSARTDKFFLSHFHSDHYGGINKNWNFGTIYCSIATANLVHAKLGVDRQYLCPLAMNTPIVIESSSNNNGTEPVRVTLLDANHCPGAVMFYFEIMKSPQQVQRRILHVGDFRWNVDKMARDGGLLTKHRIDDLLLDTTYCDPKYANTPTQDQAIAETIKVVQRHVQHNPNCRFLFGAYTIGKERIYMAVAKALNQKVHVDTQRYKTLQLAQIMDMEFFTTNRNETNVWVVPLGQISFKHLAQYDAPAAVVGFRPTGWTYKGGGASNIVSKQSRGNITVHGVPYSEHSNFSELVHCISVLKPRRIIPTVNVSKSDQQVQLLLNALKQTQTML